MLQPANKLLLNFKWVASTWHKISLKGAFGKTLQPPKLSKIMKNVLKLLQLLSKVLFWQEIFMKGLFTDEWFLKNLSSSNVKKKKSNNYCVYRKTIQNNDTVKLALFSTKESNIITNKNVIRMEKGIKWTKKPKLSQGLIQ